MSSQWHQFQSHPPFLSHTVGLRTLRCFSLGNLQSETTESHHVAQAGLELMMVLPEPLECWDSSCASPCLAVTMFFCVQVTTGSLLEETVQKWAQYKETCLKDLLEKPSGKYVPYLPIAG